MKANTKVTALEILKLAGVKKPEEKFGKIRVRIAGIAGIVDPNHLIKIQSEVKNIDIMVGEDVYKLKVNGKEKNMVVSDLAKAELNKSIEKNK